MDGKIKRLVNSKNIFLVLIFAIVVFTLCLQYKPYIYKLLLEEGLPNFSNAYLLRTFIVFIVSFIIVVSFVGKKKPEVFYLKRTEKYGAITAILISICFLLIFLFNPTWFNELAKEDYPVEWLSAFLLFSSSCIFAYLSLKRFSFGKKSKVIKWSFFLISMAFFVIAMEEISWFQRVIGFETPDAFSNNIQDEFNLHNFSTDIVENIYYLGAFTFLIILPFNTLIKPYFFESNYFSLITPRPFIIVIASIAYSYNFDMWNSVITQATFFTAILILSVLIYLSKNRIDKILITCYIIILIIQQIIFLNNPSNYDRGWEITEYKEFFIPLAVFAFSLDVFFRISHTLKTNNTI